MTKQRIIISALFLGLAGVSAVSACGGEEKPQGRLSGQEFLDILAQGNSVIIRNSAMDMNDSHHRELRGKTLVLNRGAKLTVAKGGYLYAESVILNEGATLSVEDDGQVNLEGTVTVNHGGDIYVDDGAMLSVSHDVTLNDATLIHDGTLTVRGMTKLNGSSSIGGRGDLDLDDVELNGQGAVLRNMSQGVMDDVKINGGYIFNGSRDASSVPRRPDPSLSMDYLEVNCGDCGVVNFEQWRLSVNDLTMNGGVIENKNSSSNSLTIGGCQQNGGRIVGVHTGCP